MTPELVAEGLRLGRQISRLSTQPLVVEAAAEVPIRIHSPEFEGEALAFHREFLRHIGAICTCGRAAICVAGCWFIKDKALGHLPECEPACRPEDRFRSSVNRNHPNRLKRALRQVRALNPKAYDFVFLIVARHYSFDAAMSKLNDDAVTRGLPERTPGEFAVLWVSGASMLTAAY